MVMENIYEIGPVMLFWVLIGYVIGAMGASVFAACVVRLLVTLAVGKHELAIYPFVWSASSGIITYCLFASARLAGGGDMTQEWWATYTLIELLATLAVWVLGDEKA